MEIPSFLTLLTSFLLKMASDSATTGAKSTKSKSSKAESSHPPYAEMIKNAITDLQNRKGSSRQAILKYINEHYEIHQNFADQTNVHLRQALKHGVENGTLKQIKGIGAAGSFKLADPKKKTTDGSKQKDTAKSQHATTSSPKKTKKVEAVPAAASSKKVEAVPATGSPKKTKKVEAVPAAGKTATPKKTAKKTANAKGGKKAQPIKKGRVAKK
uniref:H15 domain-containing protein n=1 Tax=Panagrolaimus sp. PS1159 TaxID=55785 RepID=A0AC35GWC4_9BILA